MPDLWSTLDSPTRVKRIMAVMMAAGHDPAVLAACLDPQTSRAAIEKAGNVTFDPQFVLQVYPNRTSVENQIVLLFPSGPVAPTQPVKDFWLCTYVDYVPA
jgi:S-methylmethionine-dependent homocysteine/selenocysteine methylase